ncbi:hypothetical protein [Paenibacillus tundrae]|uniref:hypothetical protein n=1 Tax=Paenibacillus tundrae TaxID=528187 RepID=UPI0030CB6609
MDHKKVMIFLLSSMLFISSSGSITAGESSEKIKAKLENIDYGDITLKDSAKVKPSFNLQEVSSNETKQNFYDERIPKVNLESGAVISQKNKQIEIPFTQPLDSTDEALYSHDLVIKQLGLANTPTLIPVMEYTTRVEGNQIIITFLVDYTDEYSVQVKDPYFIRSNGNLATPSDVYITTKNAPVNVDSPKVSLESGTVIPQINKEIEIPFTQPLDSTNEALYAHDLVIKQLGLTNTPTLIPMMDYTTRVEGNKIIVTFLVNYTDVFSVQVKDPHFIRSNGNLASPSEVYITTSNTPVTIESPKVSLESGTRITQSNKEIEIPFKQPLDSTDEALYAHDLVIKQLGLINTPTLIPMVEYTTRVEGNKIIVTFLVDYTDEYAVQVRDALFIRSNGIPAIQSEFYTTTKNDQLIVD